MKHLGLFEGLGGFSLAAESVGWETVAWCEINPFCQKVLRYHFPNATGYSDIKTTDFKQYANTIDIITGGFPCQPYSLAGQRKGTEDERHLWPEMLRAIREVKPTWVVGENVPGLVNWSEGLVFEQVQAELEAEGYEVQSFILPAAGVDAPHRRDRIWIIAFNAECAANGRYKPGTSSGVGMGMVGNIVDQAGRSQGSNNAESSGDNVGNAYNDQLNQERQVWGGENTEPGRVCKDAPDTNCSGLQQGRDKFAEGQQHDGRRTTRRKSSPLSSTPNATNTLCGRWRQNNIKHEASQSKLPRSGWDNFPTQSPVCFRDDGLSLGLDGITFSKWRAESIKGAGNAIVPDVAVNIFKAINEFNQGLRYR